MHNVGNGLHSKFVLQFMVNAVHSHLISNNLLFCHIKHISHLISNNLLLCHIKHISFNTKYLTLFIMVYGAVWNIISHAQSFSTPRVIFIKSPLLPSKCAPEFYPFVCNFKRRHITKMGLTFLSRLNIKLLRKLLFCRQFT